MGKSWVALCALAIAACVGVGAPVAGAAGCTNAGTPGAGFLPDCRAWEMVSPPGKNGADVAPVAPRTRAAADGSAVNFMSLAGFGDAQSVEFSNDYLSQRTGLPGTNGWATHSIGPKQPSLTMIGAFLAKDTMYEWEMSPDLTRGIYRSFRPIAASPNPDLEDQNLYLRTDLRTPGDGTYQLITKPFTEVATPSPFSLDDEFGVAGASEDFNHVAFEANLNLTEDAEGSSTKLYEWDHGSLRLAGRIPAAGAECDDEIGPACVAAESSQAGKGAIYPPRHVAPHTVSPDGSRVFFQAPAGREGGVYMREDGVRTVKLNASEREPPDSPLGASLLGATADGSTAYFLTSERLVEGDEESGSDLYAYHVDAPAGHRLVLVSADHEPSDSQSAMGIVGSSADGSYVYFISSGQLVAGEPILGAFQGLYVWHAGTVSYLGYFARPQDVSINEATTSWVFWSSISSSRVTPDGKHLIFEAVNDAGFAGHGGLRPYDHGDTCDVEQIDSACREIYLYDADTGRLRCGSCDPEGFPGAGDALLTVVANGSNSRGTSHLSHALSDDGRFVFFTTEDGLVPQDTNGDKDAYEYDSETEEVRLISSGTSPDDSFFLDASADGKDVFFATTQRLSGWDVDGNYDLYDARVNGGFPEPPPAAAPCEGEACRAGAPPAPAPEQPGSAGFNGPGNPKWPHRRCRKRRSHGKHKHRRCAPRHKHRGNNNRRAGK
jgi:hypothetical protein